MRRRRVDGGLASEITFYPVGGELKPSRPHRGATRQIRGRLDIQDMMPLQSKIPHQGTINSKLMLPTSTAVGFLTASDSLPNSGWVYQPVPRGAGLVGLVGHHQSLGNS
ncbi:questionable protein [Neurospora crassa]|uniref:Questionable protein n=2 Tax=Neurospora crassa TaxID=5141 RepID=Q1K6E2_NEUCR|nr:questionable protein [Neurospora crassa OR74A]EAA29906.1 questionable protein [Neurospora crassa OR74A]KHE88432.1 questionable protein [Neurospora crassa]CAD79651.1 questionable protein [Neurospora crassa]|eukprot:XP_959142.1 questionable protein [Neurospora crassa OR74A]